MDLFHFQGLKRKPKIQTFKKKYLLLMMIGSFFLSQPAKAGYFDLSGMFSFHRTLYGGDNVQWSRRWAAGVGYVFFDGRSEVEFSYTEVFLRTQFPGVQDTEFLDRIYSVQWVQGFFKRGAIFDPYVKVGVGQLNRNASGTYSGGGAPPAIFDSLTGVLGVGIRIPANRRFSIRTEATTYLPGAVLSAWKDNLAFQVGFSWYI